MPDEVEIKLEVASAAAALDLLRPAGFTPGHERAFEANEVFDTPARTLLEARSLLRLRSFRGEAILTFKGPPRPGPHKSRPEFETAVETPGAMLAILQGLGFQVVFRYEKYRTSFSRPGEPGHAVLDETPIGAYLELEGPPDWIDRTAAGLGFARDAYITASYGTLYRDWCQARGLAPTHMVFTV